MANPFMDHLKNNPINRDQPNLNSGGLAKRRGGGNNRNRNKNRNRNGGGGGGGNDNTGLGPALPDVNADIGLQGPNVGSVAPNPFQAHMGGGTLPVGQTLFSGDNAYERNVALEDPQRFYNAFLANAGVNTLGDDNLAQWASTDGYARYFDEWNRLRTDDQNQNLDWYDFLGNRAGVPYGTADWDAAVRAMVQRDYQATPLDRRGTNYAPYAGLGRWLTVG